jgi:TFIIF-interacting CTD phosphatase-like protein
MSYLQNQMNALRYDKRLLEMNLKNGTITHEEYDQFIKELRDDDGNATQLDLATEAEDNISKMNGQSHPTGVNQEPPAAPTNNDPFGSGF